MNAYDANVLGELVHLFDPLPPIVNRDPGDESDAPDFSAADLYDEYEEAV